MISTAVRILPPALCLAVIEDAYFVVLPRVGNGGLDVYELGLEMGSGVCNGPTASVMARRGAWLHVIVTDEVLFREFSPDCAEHGAPECLGCMIDTYRRRDLFIDPLDGTHVMALNSDRSEVTQDGDPEVDFDVVATLKGVAAEGEKCAGPEWLSPH